jgi:NAD(P)-dependent dehydrogenase (short-subunit alcohol dehydrogenase family)
MDLGLKERVAIVTGAGRGIGRATALAFANEGASVVLAARSAPEIESTAAEIRQRLTAGGAGRVLAIPCDVTSEGQVASMITRTIEAYGRIDVLVNNAGYSKQCPIADLSVEELRRALDVNLVGTFLCCRAVLPTMKRQGSGRIINVVSGAGKRGSLRRGAYAAAKFGVIGFSQCLQLEVKPDGIGVCCVCPGPVDTLMRTVNNPGEDPRTLLPPEEIADAIVFAASRGPLTVIPEIEVRPRGFVAF